MKKLLIMILLLAATAACTREKQPTAVVLPDPKYVYMQEVSIVGGFLRGQSGTVVRYYWCDKEVPDADKSYCYDVKLKNDEVWNNIEEKSIQ